jgi:3-oxoisoapionate decarboxylase
MTRLGLGTYAFAWSIGVPGYDQPPNPMDALAFLQRCVDLGVSVAQIADNIPLHMLTPDERAALKAYADEHGLAIEIGTRGISPAHLQQYLAIAAEFGSPILRVVVDTADHHPDVPEIIATLRDMLPEFEQRNIVLAIENHDRFRVAQLVNVMQSVDGSYVGICLDTVNSFGSLEGPQMVVQQLGPYVVNLHVKDFRIARVDHNMGFVLTGTPAGEGMLDVPWLLAELDRHGCSFNAIIELWPAPEADIAATVALEMAWAQRSVNSMRQWIKD